MMNKKQIEAQIEKLTKKKELAEERKRQAIEKCDAEIAEINGQILSFKKTKEQLDKLEKQQQELMEQAARMLKSEG